MKSEAPVPALRTPSSGNASLSVGAMGARQLTFTKIPTIDIVQNSRGNRGWLPSTLAFNDPDPELYRLSPAAAEDDHISKPRLHSGFDLSLDISRDDPDYLAGNIMLVPNQWPDWLPGFRDDVMAYYDAVMALGNRLFRAFAIALNLPESFFVDRAKKPTSQLRLLH